MPEPTYYEILGLRPDADQAAISRAFRRRAVQTHPDKNPGAQAADRFMRVIKAYQVLSDVHRRAAYDLRTLRQTSKTASYGVTIEDALRSEYTSVMDSPADDVLEEYITGNRPPDDTSLMTFFRDLEQTDVFILFRDAKEAFVRRAYVQAAAILDLAVRRNPSNILYRHFYACSLGELGQTRRALRQFRAALRIGELRRPEKMCPGVRRAMYDLCQRKRRFIRAWWMRRKYPELKAPPPTLDYMAEYRIRLKRLAILEARRLDRITLKEEAESRRLARADQFGLPAPSGAGESPDSPSGPELETEATE